MWMTLKSFKKRFYRKDLKINNLFFLTGNVILYFIIYLLSIRFFWKKLFWKNVLIRLLTRCSAWNHVWQWLVWFPILFSISWYNPIFRKGKGPTSWFMKNIFTPKRKLIKPLDIIQWIHDRSGCHAKFLRISNLDWMYTEQDSTRNIFQKNERNNW